MSKKIYCIIYDQAKNQISLGDVIRVLRIVKKQNHFLVTNKKNINFFKKLTNRKVKNIKTFKYLNFKGKIVNLVVGKKLEDSFFDINDHIKFKSSKIKTFKVFDNLQKKFEIPIEKIHLKKKKKYKIGFNSIVPKNWNIKSYPKKSWNELDKNLKISNLKICILRQKRNNLLDYLNWIKQCDLIVSVVGLGAHICNYLDKQVVMLVGPTNFSESKKDQNIFQIFPKKRCNVHKKRLNVYYKDCFCMKNIDPKEVSIKVLSALSLLK